MSDATRDRIEVTPEMTEAGADVIFAYREEAIAWTLAERVYRAMELAKKRQQMIAEER